MTDRDLRRRCQEKIKTLHIPRPFSIDQLRAELEHQRARALQFTPIRTRPGTPCGLWIALAKADYIFYEQDTTPLHQLHIIGHETGHMLLDHHGTHITSDELIQLLLPSLDPDLIRSVLGRTTYTDAEEHEAETFASLLLKRIAPHHAEPMSPEQAELLGRVEGAFGPARLRRPAVINGVFLTVAALALIAAAIKARAAVRPGHPSGQGMLVLLFTTLGLTCLFLSYAAQVREQRIYPDLPRLLANITTMIAAFALLALVLTISNPPAAARPKIRRRLAALAASVATLTVIFAWVSPLPRTFGDFGHQYWTKPTLLVYIAVFIAFLGAALTELLLVTWRYARLARSRRYLRLGLRLIAAGAIMGLVYLAEKIAYVITQTASLTPPFGTDQHCTSPIHPGQCAFEITLTTTAIMISITGATLPVWGPALAAPLRRSWRARTCRQLEPLWRALYAALLEIALAEPPPDGTRPRHDLGFVLYRRMIEIDDGLLLLRPHLDPAVRQAALTAARLRGLIGDDLEAAAEAAQIGAALHARTAGIPPAVTTTPLPDASTRTGPRSEAAWLAKVSTAFTSSPTTRRHTQQSQDKTSNPERTRLHLPAT
jgi:hypothetical protein